jgi:hypothetical protein
MKRNSLLVYSLVVAFIVSLSSCEIVGGIFKAGVWTGIILVAVVVGIIIWAVSKASGRK